MRSKLSTIITTRRNRTPQLNIEQLPDVEVAQDYAQQLAMALPTEEQLGAATLEDGWRDIRSAIGSVVTVTRTMIFRKIYERIQKVSIRFKSRC